MAASPKASRKLALGLLSAAALAAVAPTVHAAPYAWSSASNTTWSTSNSANWTPSFTTNVAGDTFTFNADPGSGKNVAMGQNLLFTTMTFSSGGWNISDAGSFTLTGATSSTISVATGSSDTFNGILAGMATKLTKSGGGTLVLGGANTYTGSTNIASTNTISGNTLELSSTESNAGATGATGAFSVTDNATLIIDASSSTSTVTRGGNVTSAESGKIILNGSAGNDSTDFFNGALQTGSSPVRGNFSIIVNAQAARTTQLKFATYGFTGNKSDLFLEGANFGQTYTGTAGQLASGVAQVKFNSIATTDLSSSGTGTQIIGAAVIHDTVSGETSFAANDATNGLRPLVDSDPNDYGTVNTLTANMNARITSSVAASGSVTINSLTLRSSGVTGVTLSGNTADTITMALGGSNNANGILSDGTAANTISGIKIDSEGAQGLTIHTIADLTISSQITNIHNGLVKANGGTLTLSNPNNSFTSSGPAIITGGVLSLSATGNVGSSSVAVDLGGGTLRITESITFNHPITIFNNDTALNEIQVSSGKTVTFSGVLSQNGNTGGLSYTGPGTAIFSGANTFSNAPVNIRAGTVGIGVSNVSTSTGALGSSSSSVINLGDTTGSADATLVTTGAFTFANAITVRTGSSGTMTLGGSTADASIFSGTVTFGTSGANPTKDAKFVAAAGGSVDFQGLLAENTNNTNVANLTIGDPTNTGTVKFSNAANSYSGSTTINGGTLEITKLAAGASNSSIGNSAGAAANLVLNGGTLKYTGAGDTTSRLFTIGANGGAIDASAAANAAITFSGAGSLAAAGTGNRTLTLTGASTGANTLTSIITDPSSGATSLSKTGAGTWVLGGANSYTGTTTVSGGTLKLAAGGSISNSNKIIVGDTGAGPVLDVSLVSGGFKVTANQILAGHGTITGAVTVLANGHTAPGNSIGATSYSTGLTYNAGAILDYELGTGNGDTLGSSSAGSISDLIAVSGGALVLPSSGTVTLNLSDNAGADGKGTLGAGTYKLFSYTSLTGGNPTFGDTFLLGTAPNAFDYSVINNGASNEIDLVVTPAQVPEPASLALLGMGAACLLTRRRKS